MNLISCFNTAGDYMEISELPVGAVEVAQRPSEFYDYVAGAWVVNLDRCKASKIASLYASFSGATYADITFTNAALVSANYQTDEASRARISRALASYTPGGAVPAGFYWVDAANVKQTTTLMRCSWMQLSLLTR